MNNSKGIQKRVRINTRNHTGQALDFADIVDPGSKPQHNKVLVIVDESSSMYEHVGVTSNSKWDHLLLAIDQNFAGSPDTPCIAFGCSARWAEILNLEIQGGSTALGQALSLGLTRYGKSNIDQVILISDGEVTDSEREDIELAVQYGVPFNCIFIGDDEDYGAKFLKELAAATQGDQQTVNDENAATIKELGTKIAGFLGTGRGPIQL